MLRIDPKLPADEIPISWNASYLLNSFPVPSGLTINSCTCSIAVAPWSEVQDPSVGAMLDGAAVVNSSAATFRGQTFPPGTIVTQYVKNGVPGATYILTFTPAYSVTPLSEGEQIVFDVVAQLPNDGE
jgi:hypothetical protein